VLAGVGAPGGGTGGALALSDSHGDVLGQFTAVGTSVAGSQAYDPWGTVTAATGTMTGMLGFQSAWTDPAAGKDLMGARWYNPAAGDFTSADTVRVSPVPVPAAASPFGYAADEPLDLTDPTGHYVDPGGSARDNPGYTDQVTYSLAYTAQVWRVGPVRAAKAATAATARVHAVVKATNAQIAAAKKRAAQQAAKKRAAASLKPKDKPGSKGPKLPSNNPSCPSGSVDPLECWNMNFLFEKDSSTSTGDTSDRILSELPCLTGVGFVTISGCGTLNAAASGREDSSGDGNSNPGASGDDPNDLPNLPNLAKEDANIEQALRQLANKRVTTGQILDSSGKVISREIEAGGSSDLVKQTDAYLRQNGAPLNPKAEYYPASQHVEAQYAMWMRQKGVTDATVVINNAEGVCSGIYGCQAAVREILPEGSTMTIWYPGATEPVVIPGEAAAP
jgi:RHS repeat-associated protein